MKEKNSLSRTVDKAWDNFDLVKLANIWNRWWLVLDFTINDTSSDRLVELKSIKSQCPVGRGRDHRGSSWRWNKGGGCNCCNRGGWVGDNHNNGWGVGTQTWRDVLLAALTSSSTALSFNFNLLNYLCVVVKPRLGDGRKVRSFLEHEPACTKLWDGMRKSNDYFGTPSFGPRWRAGLRR